MTTTPSRRTILRSAAWTAPAVAVVAAAPAHAASVSHPTLSTSISRAGSGQASVSATLGPDATLPAVVTMTVAITTEFAGLLTISLDTWSSEYLPGGSFVFTRTISPGETALLGFYWYLQSGDGRIELAVTVDGAATDPIVIPWAAPGARRSVPVPTTSAFTVAELRG